MENITVKQLRQKCKTLNISLTKSDGTHKLKKDLVRSLIRNIRTSQTGGKRRRRSKTTSRKRRSRKRRSRKRRSTTSSRERISKRINRICSHRSNNKSRKRKSRINIMTGGQGVHDLERLIQRGMIHRVDMLKRDKFDTGSPIQWSDAHKEYYDVITQLAKHQHSKFNDEVFDVNFHLPTGKIKVEDAVKKLLDHLKQAIQSKNEIAEEKILIDTRVSDKIKDMDTANATAATIIPPKSQGRALHNATSKKVKAANKLITKLQKWLPHYQTAAATLKTVTELVNSQYETVVDEGSKALAIDPKLTKSTATLKNKSLQLWIDTIDPIEAAARAENIAQGGKPTDSDLAAAIEAEEARPLVMLRTVAAADAKEAAKRVEASQVAASKAAVRGVGAFAMMNAADEATRAEAASKASASKAAASKAAVDEAEEEAKMRTAVEGAAVDEVAVDEAEAATSVQVTAETHSVVWAAAMAAVEEMEQAAATAETAVATAEAAKLTKAVGETRAEWAAVADAVEMTERAMATAETAVMAAEREKADGGGAARGGFRPRRRIIP